MKREYKSKTISIRTDDDLEKKLDLLEERLMINRTSVVRLAVAKLYEHEFDEVM